ncbi:MAG: TPM domain-containing protein [Bacteroidales bacterium]|nr:TPM domain-containing protein [Lentimicrobiaceae bacterium]MDD5695943.1 TPM domain-containing protein [Bacteroidales bacterium]
MKIKASAFFTALEKEDIRMAIRQAELDTSGEIRVHIETTCTGDVMDRASRLFEKLKMHETRLRNGILIYLAIHNRKFAIIGDAGINAVVPENFWDNIEEDMISHFRENKFLEGLLYAIEKAGLQLKKHFPYVSGDINELPDDISFSDE